MPAYSPFKTRRVRRSQRGQGDVIWLKGLVVQWSLSLSKGACRREPAEGSLSKGACRREPVEGSLVFFATYVSLTQSREGCAESAKSNHFLASLAKNLATLAVPYLPSSVPESPLALGTKGYRPQLRSSDFILRSPITYMPYKPLHVLYGKKI